MPMPAMSALYGSPRSFPAQVSETAMLQFQEEWHRLDPDGTYYIGAHYATALIKRLYPPLGFHDSPHTSLQIYLHMRAAWIPVRDGKVLV